MSKYQARLTKNANEFDAIVTDMLQEIEDLKAEGEEHRDVGRYFYLLWESSGVSARPATEHRAMCDRAEALYSSLREKKHEGN